MYRPTYTHERKIVTTDLKTGNQITFYEYGWFRQREDEPIKDWVCERVESEPMVFEPGKQ